MEIDQVEVSADGRRVHGWSEGSSLEIRAPLEGVLRVRHMPRSLDAWAGHPQLPEKQSWAVVHDAAHEVSLTRHGEAVRIEGRGVALLLELGSTRWRFHGADDACLAQCERVTGEYTAAYPMGRSRSRIELHAPKGEAYLGFGEKVGGLDKRGMHLTFWNTDVMPHHPDTDPLYQSIPFFLAVHEGVCWGLLLDETWRSEVDVALTDRHRLTWESAGPELDTYLIAGPRPEDVLRRYTQLTGRPPLSALWTLGAQQSRWGYETAEEIRAIVEGYRSRGLPLDCVYLDIDHLDGYRTLTWDRSRFAEPGKLAAELAEKGVRLVPIVDPALKAQTGYPLYDEALERDLLVRTDRGDVLEGEVWPTPAVYPDFTQERVRTWWGEHHRPHVEKGIAGFWYDMNEPSAFRVNDPHRFSPQGIPVNDPGRIEGPTLPYDARHGARRHLEMHNVYALAMCQGGFEALAQLAPERRPFLLTRAGFAGIQRYAAVWTGDNSSHWSQLESSITMILGLGLSGVAFAGADIPGFLGRPSDELFIRWHQAGAFYPLMRNHAVKGAPSQEPWRRGPRVLELTREALERRYRLLPLLYTLMHEASHSGLPVMRALFLQAPGDPEALRAQDQFLFGPDLLVAPIVRSEQTHRMVYLPEGRWLRWNNLERVGEIEEGGRYVLAAAALDTVPIFLRAGGAVPLTTPAQHTTSARWRELTWHVLADARITGTLYEDAGEGFGPSSITRLEGGLDDTTLRIVRTMSGAPCGERDVEHMRIYGLSSVAMVEGATAHAFRDGVLEVELESAWTELVVRT